MESRCALQISIISASIATCQPIQSGCGAWGSQGRVKVSHLGDCFALQGLLCRAITKRALALGFACSTSGRRLWINAVKSAAAS